MDSIVLDHGPSKQYRMGYTIYNYDIHIFFYLFHHLDLYYDQFL